MKNKDPILVMLQLTGGNDYLNTVIPYQDPNYYDNRPTLNFGENNIHKLNADFAFNPSMLPMKKIFDRGNMAILNGVGWESPTRSHFRAMDIWHTAEPDKVGHEGWIAKIIREIDPNGENPIAAVNVGYGLPRALVAPNVSVASVADLDNYGMLTSIDKQKQREHLLNRFASMYAPAIGSGPVMDYLVQTGLDALKGADTLKIAPETYSSSVEYGSDSLGTKMKDIARILLADLGTRVFYVEHGGFDTHAAQAPNHAKLWNEVSKSVADFWDDLYEHSAVDNVLMVIFSEFGRRVKENGSGTDHGAAGAVFAIGPQVKGGFYGDYPKIRAEELVNGDLAYNVDFRSLYSTVIEDWFSLDSIPLLNGNFSKSNFISKVAV